MSVEIHPQVLLNIPQELHSTERSHGIEPVVIPDSSGEYDVCVCVPFGKVIGVWKIFVRHTKDLQRCLKRVKYTNSIAPVLSAKFRSVGDSDLVACNTQDPDLILEEHTKSITMLTSCNGDLVSASLDKTVRIWNTPKGTCLLVFRDEMPLCLNLHPMGKTTLLVGSDSLSLWDSDATRNFTPYLPYPADPVFRNLSARELARLDLKCGLSTTHEHSSSLPCFAVAVRSSVCFWSVISCSLSRVDFLPKKPTLLHKHKGTITSFLRMEKAWDKEGLHYFVSSSLDKTMRVWKLVERSEEIETIAKQESWGKFAKQHVAKHRRSFGRYFDLVCDQTLAITPQTSWPEVFNTENYSSKKANAQKDQAAKLLELETGRAATKRVASGMISSVEASDDNPFSALVHVWDILKGDCVATLRRTDAGLTNPCPQYTPNSLSMIECRQVLVCADLANTSICLWNHWDGIKQTLEGHRAGIMSLKEVRGGRIASLSLDKTIRIWGGRVQLTLKPYKTALIDFSCVRVLNLGDSISHTLEPQRQYYPVSYSMSGDTSKFYVWDTKEKEKAPPKDAAPAFWGKDPVPSSQKAPRKPVRTARSIFGDPSPLVPDRKYSSPPRQRVPQILHLGPPPRPQVGSFYSPEPAQPSRHRRRVERPVSQKEILEVVKFHQQYEKDLRAAAKKERRQQMIERAQSAFAQHHNANVSDYHESVAMRLSDMFLAFHVMQAQVLRVHTKVSLTKTASVLNKLRAVAKAGSHVPAVGVFNAMFKGLFGFLLDREVAPLIRAGAVFCKQHEISVVAEAIAQSLTNHRLQELRKMDVHSDTLFSKVKRYVLAEDFKTEAEQFAYENANTLFKALARDPDAYEKLPLQEKVERLLGAAFPEAPRPVLADRSMRAAHYAIMPGNGNFQKLEKTVKALRLEIAQLKRSHVFQKSVHSSSGRPSSAGDSVQDQVLEEADPRALAATVRSLQRELAQMQETLSVMGPAVAQMLELEKRFPAEEKKE